MSQRSGPIIARRLSLPYSNLPPLLPKPSILKRLNQTQISSPNGVINVHHINAQKVVLSPAKTVKELATKATLRPVPGLNKVVNVSNTATTNAPVTKQTLTLLRKSLPLPSTSNAKPASGTAPLLMPIKRAHITRLPPTLKPAPRLQAGTSVKTYSKLDTGNFVEIPIPIISRVQNVKQIIKQKSGNTPTAIQCSKSAQNSSPTEQKSRNTGVMWVSIELCLSKFWFLFNLK